MTPYMDSGAGQGGGAVAPGGAGELAAAEAVVPGGAGELAAAEAVVPGGAVRGQDGPRVRTVWVGMADGARLATDVCLPARSGGPYPAVVMRTPYDRRRHRAELCAWAARGFAAVAQDVRGRHASQGEWHPYRGEGADGAATLRWLRGQTWSDGRVIAHGASYGAYCALATVLGDASADGRSGDVQGEGGPGEGRSGEGVPDAVIAAVPALGTAETAREPGGPERLLARAGWWAAHGDRPDSDPSALDEALARDPRLLEHLPVLDLPHRLGRELPSWAGVWDDCRRGRLALRAGRARVPLLAVGGARDPFADDTVELWQRWGGPARLLMGPWGHELTASPGGGAGERQSGHYEHRLNLGELYVHWARTALDAGLASGRRGAVALVGSGLWCGAGDGGAADGRVADGRVLVHAFGSRSGLRVLRGADFVADPQHPVRSDDLAVPEDGPADRCLLVTPPLPRPVDVLGTASVRFRARSSTPSADWAVRVVALDPEGRAEPLALGVVRRMDGPGRAGGTGRVHGSSRPDAECQVNVSLGHLARRLPAGTRLRVEIAGHHFPAHARNPHTGEDPMAATRLLPSRRTVLMADGALLLPVAPPRSFAAAVDPVQEICT